MSTKLEKKTAQQIANLRSKIDIKKARREELSFKSSRLADEILDARVRILKLSGWDVVRADRWSTSYVAKLVSGSTWYGLWQAENMQRRRERAAAKRKEKASNGSVQVRR